MPTIEEIQEFFFQAKQAGWATGAKAHLVPGKPGFKQISFSTGDWRLVDEWCKNTETNQSAGCTVIWYRDVPVWYMTYGGYYDAESVKICKAALVVAYEASEFHGCRGPRSFKKDGWLYRNDYGGNFSFFHGSETVRREEDKGMDEPHGIHEYMGMALIK